MKREIELDRAIRDAFAEEAAPRQIHKAILAACESLPEKKQAKGGEHVWASIDESRLAYPEEYRKPPLIRRLAVAAFCLIIAGSLGLLGLNAISPEITESLPGLGGIFRAINGERQSPSLPEKKPDLPSFPEAYSEEGSGLSVLPVEDNGTILQKIQVDRSGLEVKITAEVPFMGRTSYDPLQYYRSIPFGTWADLHTVEEAERLPGACIAGTLLSGRSDDGENGRYQTGSGLSDRSSQAAWTFNNVDMDQLLVLTVYEWDLFWDGKEPLGNYRVTAEFTVDLKNGTAMPSEHYKEAGLQKITPEECLSTHRTCGFANGWIPAGVDCVSLSAYSASAETFYRIDLFGYIGSLPSPENLTLECYRAGELLGTVSTQGEGERGQPMEVDEAFRMSMGNQTYYPAENGRYADEETERGRMESQSRHVVFAVPASLFGYEEDWQADQALINNEIRFALRSADTGELIYEDIMERHREYKQGIIDLYEENTRLSGSAAGPAGEENVSREPAGTFDIPSALPEEGLGPFSLPYTSPMPSPTPLPNTFAAPIAPALSGNGMPHMLGNDP